MALELISTNEISPNSLISLPHGKRNGKVIQYSYSNSALHFFYEDCDKLADVRIGVWTAPENARRIGFQFYHIEDAIRVIPIFYDKEGNTLKIGNR